MRETWENAERDSGIQFPIYKAILEHIISLCLT